MTRYRIERRGKRYYVQVVNSVLGVGAFGTDVGWHKSPKAARSYVKKWGIPE